MRARPAFLVVAAFATMMLPPPALSAPIKLPHLIKAEDKICERKPDGTYCGRGLKKKHLFRCVSGVIDATYLCDFGCDPKGQTCLKKKPRAGGAQAAPAPATDCHFTGQLKRAEQAGLPCR